MISKDQKKHLAIEIKHSLLMGFTLWEMIFSLMSHSSSTILS